MPKKIEVKNAVTRKAGYLYFVDGKGNVVSTPMKRKKKVAAAKAKATKGKATTKKKRK